MKNYIYAALVVLGTFPVAYAGEEKSVLAPTPAPAVVIESATPTCVNGRCCLNGKCFIKEPRFERHVSVTSTCDSCGVKETSRTVTRTRRRR